MKEREDEEKGADMRKSFRTSTRKQWTYKHGGVGAFFRSFEDERFQSNGVCGLSNEQMALKVKVRTGQDQETGQVARNKP